MKIFLSITLVLLVLMQFVRVELKNSPVDKDIALKAPKNIEKILQKSLLKMNMVNLMKLN